MKIRFRPVILLSCVLASGAMGSGPSAGSDPVGPARSRLTGLPGPGGTGLLPIEVSGPARTHGELDLEIERFLVEEVDRNHARIAWNQTAFRSDAVPLRIPLSPASGAIVVGGPVVSVQPPAGWDSSPLGMALALGLFHISEAGQRDLRACQTFLETRGDALRTFWASNRREAEEPARPELLAAVEKRKSEIRSYPLCRGLVSPEASRDSALRIPEGLP